MTLPWLIFMFAAVGGWAMLNLLGGERQRRLRELEAQQPTPAAPAPSSTPVPPKK